MQSRVQQRGVAMITALFVVSIAAITSVSLISRQHIDIRRTANVLNLDQAYMYTLGMEALGKEIILRATGTKKYDDPKLFSEKLAFPVEGGSVAGELEDMEKRFNVNNLIRDDKDSAGNLVPNSQELARFTAILTMVMNDLQLGDVSAGELANAVADWIDPDASVTFPGGAEDSEYMSAEVPYRAANRMLASPTELLLVQGFTRELLYGKVIAEEHVPGLLEYVTALPDNATTINLNTVDPRLLLTFSTKWTQAEVDSALSGRENTPFDDVAKFKQQFSAETQKKIENDLSGLDVQSSYMMIHATAAVADNSLRLNSLIYRSTSGSKIYTVSRSQGTEGI